MAGAHLAIPDAQWLANLALSAALGTAAYAAAVLAVGLEPNERTTALRMAGKATGRARARP